jgi:threonylcarbamoyladenosine tRNA methylthiotransferase MtaB
VNPDKARGRVRVETLGCKLNQAESEAIARNFVDAGFEIAGAGDADLIVLNTCTVTHAADRKARHLVHMLRKANPAAQIVATGCYAERAATELKDSGADRIVANRDKERIPEIISWQGQSGITDASELYKQERRIRSFVKIQDGCRRFCSYCIVPFVRKDEYCTGSNSVINEVKAREREGCKEIVLTGTEIGAYRDGDTDLCGLGKRLLRETTIPRIHLSSLQPQEITAGLISLWQDKRLIRHFHLALQSGSDAVLKRMNRQYDSGCFSGAVREIRRALPDASITTDIMVGFPGETETEFEQSFILCRNMEFAAIHVFSYSSRPGTASAGFPGRINERLKKDRSLRVLNLAAGSADRFAHRFIGQIRNVLWESETRPGSGIFVGLTDNYLRVYEKSAANMHNTIAEARLVRPASEMGGRNLRMSTRGNYGELWAEVVR